MRVVCVVWRVVCSGAQDREVVLDEAEAAQRRRAEAAREAAARGDRAAVVRLQDPDHLPGEPRFHEEHTHTHTRVQPFCALR